MLGETCRRRRTERARKAAGNVHPLAAHIGTRRPPPLERGRVLDEVHAHFLEDDLGVMLDQFERLVVQDLEIRYRAGDVARALVADRGAFRPPRRTAAAARPAPTPLASRFHRIAHVALLVRLVRGLAQSGPRARTNPALGDEKRHHPP